MANLCSETTVKRHPKGSKMTAKIKKIIISENTVIPFPTKSLKSLSEIIKNRGVLKDIQNNCGLMPSAVKSIIENGKAQKGNVDKLIVFVDAYTSGDYEGH